MILRRIARPRAIAKQFEQISQQSAIPLALQQQRRSLHHVPPLGDTNNSTGNYFNEQGVPGFLSPRTFRQTWTEYQQYLVDQINAKVTDTEYATKTPYQIHAEFSRQPEHADFYNIAAMAHLNHLWWESLSATKKEIPDTLRKDIDVNYHSVDDLRTEMLEHADAMFGNGFVWLMKETNSAMGQTSFGKFRILCTYNAGSPYAEAYRMRQNRDMATHLDPAAQRRAQMTQVQNTAGSFGNWSSTSRGGDAPPNQLQAVPLLCLNVWQHMWIPDYGILGKRAYLAAWWERIDWDVVQRRHLQQSRMGYGNY